MTQEAKNLLCKYENSLISQHPSKSQVSRGLSVDSECRSQRWVPEQTREPDQPQLLCERFTGFQ